MIRSSQLAREWADGCGMSIDHHAFETRGKSLANSQFVALKALKKEDFPVRRSREREKRHAKGADKFRNSQKCKEPERRAKDERGRISRKLDNCTRSPWALVESLVFFFLSFPDLRFSYRSRNVSYLKFRFVPSSSFSFSPPPSEKPSAKKSQVLLVSDREIKDCADFADKAVV